MRNNKKHWVLLFGLIILLLSSAVGCGQPGFTTYKNDAQGIVLAIRSVGRSRFQRTGQYFL